MAMEMQMEVEMEMEPLLNKLCCALLARFMEIAQKVRWAPAIRRPDMEDSILCLAAAIELFIEHV